MISQVPPPATPATPAAAPDPAPGPRPNALKRLYTWVIHWADTRYALPALVVLAFIESSFFPIPPDVLLLALCFSAPRKSLVYAAWCTAASVAGGVLGYFIGYGLYEQVGARIIGAFGYEHHWAKVGELYGDNAFLAILAAAFTPIPYKVFTIAAGAFHEQVSLGVLVAASIVGRGGRFFLVAAVIRIFGPKVRTYVEKYLEIATILLLLLGIAGFAAIKLLH